LDCLYFNNNLFHIVWSFNCVLLIIKEDQYFIFCWLKLVQVFIAIFGGYFLIFKYSKSGLSLVFTFLPLYPLFGVNKYSKLKYQDTKNSKDNLLCFSCLTIACNFSFVIFFSTNFPFFVQTYRWCNRHTNFQSEVRTCK